MPFHAIAVLPGGRQKTIPNRTESEMLNAIVLPYKLKGVIKAYWGDKSKSYQVLELRVYETPQPWDKKVGSLDDHVGKKKNRFAYFEKRVQELIGVSKFRVFVVMPIQGEKYGTQEDQRIFKEYDERFLKIESVVSKFGCVAIRIDKEAPLEGLVDRIKKEINDSTFVIADLTDERPSCYFEVGFAEALGRPVIHIASKDSVIKPGAPTKIHFDIHKSVQFFSNHKELKAKLMGAIVKNKSKLLPVK